MPSKLQTSYEGDHILVIADGDKDIEFATRMWQQVAALVHEHQCFRVLGLANTTTPLEVVDGYEHARLFADVGMPRKTCIAWVESNAEAVDIASFIELVLSNRGYCVRVFATEAEARAWLNDDRREQAEV